MGCDSGATIAQLLAASPITTGLFDQVIAMSPLNTNMAGLSQLDAREVSIYTSLDFCLYSVLCIIL